MTRKFGQHSMDTAPAESRPALEAIGKGLGFVPNLFATLAESPTTLEGYLALETVLAKGSFTAKERQLILTAVSSGDAFEHHRWQRTSLAA